MGIAYDAVSNSGHQAKETTTYNWDHTCTGTGLVLLVHASVKATGVGGFVTVSAVTCDDVPFALIDRQQSWDMDAELWRLYSPAAGTHVIKVILSEAGVSGDGSHAVALSLTGADSVEASGKNTTYNATLPITVITATANAWIVTGVFKESYNTDPTVDLGTIAWRSPDWSGPGAAMAYYGPVATPGAVTITWGPAETLRFSGVGAAIKPMAAPPAAAAHGRKHRIMKRVRYFVRP